MRVCSAEAPLTSNEMKEALEHFHLMELIKNDDGC